MTSCHSSICDPWDSGLSGAPRKGLVSLKKFPILRTAANTIRWCMYCSGSSEGWCWSNCSFEGWYTSSCSQASSNMTCTSSAEWQLRDDISGKTSRYEKDTAWHHFAGSVALGCVSYPKSGANRTLDSQLKHHLIGSTCTCMPGYWLSPSECVHKFAPLLSPSWGISLVPGFT